MRKQYFRKEYPGKMYYRRVGALLAAGALVSTLAACGSGDDDNEGGGGGSAAPTQSSAQKGGTFTMLLPVEAASLNPFQTSYATVTDLNRVLALYDALVYLDNTDGKVKPQIAESLTAGEGGKVWTLKIKPNVKFTDGTPYDAAAVKTNWDLHAKAETQSYHRAAAGGLVNEVVDPQTLKITLPVANMQFDRVVAADLAYIASPTNLAKDPKGQNPVGAGPFKFESWQRDAQMTFVKNPTYWQGPDKPQLDKVVFKYVPDVGQQLQTVKNGGADLFFTIDPMKTKDAKENGLGVTPFTLDGGQTIAFNTSKPPFDNPKARKAVALALDPADLNNVAFKGAAVPGTSILNPKGKFFDPTATQAPTNKAEAQKLFDELAAEGKPLKFTYTVPDNPASNNTAEYTMTALNSFKNVKVDLTKVNPMLFTQETTYKKNFEAALNQLWASDPEPVLYNYFFSKSPQNQTGYNNPKADAALLAGRAATDDAARKAAYAELQKQLIADVPIVAYQEAVTNIISTSKVAGVVGVNDGGLLFDRVVIK